ncbi:MAG TPA: phospholipase D-like domain-containing protein, partial [Longilinea sp.]|nr:phospholipase D-like domain-containing protein [Longilinea sp.]
GSEQGLSTLLVEAIDDAQYSIDVAMYNFSMDDVGDALIRAYRRGVQVRVVMESENSDGVIPQGLIAAGIPFIGDGQESLMHNKFMVIDQQTVWSGSLNYSTEASISDSNNLISIQDAMLAADYTVEFEEMFTQGLFSAYSPADTPYPQVNIGGALVEVYFSPEDNPQVRLEDLISEAGQSIVIMAYVWTDNGLTDAVLERASAGVRVSGVFDSELAFDATGSDFPTFQENGLDVRLDGYSGLLHQKVIIIDGSIVVVGSYNFTASAADRNDENLVIIHDPRLAAFFLNNFAEVFADAQP